MDIASLWAALPLAQLGPFGVALLMCFVFVLTPGPISGIIVQNTLRYGFAGGIFLCVGCILGAVMAAFIASLPFLFGITAISDWLLANADKASIGFGLLIVVLGALNLRPMKVREADYRGKPLYTLYSALYVGLHPGNILAFATLVTLLQSSQTLAASSDTLWVLLGVALGASLAWSIYMLACLKARVRMTPQLLQKIRFGVGILLMLIGTAVSLRGLLLL